MTAPDSATRFDRLWESRKPLIGMIHLMPLPGAPAWGGSMRSVLDRALDDARALVDAGFDGLIVENFLDAPFFPTSVPAETVAGLTVAVSTVLDLGAVPVGVNVLRNDAAAALGIAATTGASFIRVNVHTGAMWTDQGLIEGRAHETVRLRARLAPEVAILADVHVKHATPPAGSSLVEAARDAWHRGHADALIVSGSGTARATNVEEVRSVKDAVPDAPVLVGSGANAVSAPELLDVADGAIIGSAVMNAGRPGTGVDPARAADFIGALRG